MNENVNENEKIKFLKEYIDTINGILRAYSDIGTVEEFKALKDDSIPIIHGKAELELHDKEIRNKTVDDFVNSYMEKYGFDTIGNVQIITIAEQLKGER